MINIIKIAVWFVLFLLGLDISFELISASNTLLNICGFLFGIIIMVISYKTKCLTNLKLKNEK